MILVKSRKVRTTSDSSYIEKCDTIIHSRRNKQHGENKYNAFHENLYKTATLNLMKNMCTLH